MLCKLEFQAQQILVSVFSSTPMLINMPSEMIACGQRCSGGFGYQVCEKPKECFVQDSTHDIKRHVQGLPRSAPWFVGSTGKELQFSLDCLAACAQVLGQ